MTALKRDLILLVLIIICITTEVLLWWSKSHWFGLAWGCGMVSLGALGRWVYTKLR